MFGFDPEKLYRPQDPAMGVITSPGQLAKWRHYGKGPPFILMGRKVFYSGADLIRWIEENRVDPGEAA